MSVRGKSYKDYGLTDKQVSRLIKYCRSGKFIEHETLAECAKASNPILADMIAETITKKISYERLCARYYVPIDKNSFYGYRRKCISLLYRRIGRKH